MSERIRVLYVDDNPHDRELVRDALEVENQGFEIVLTSNREEFETELCNKQWDVILSDFNILGYSGLQVINAVKEIYLETPIIIITGTGTEEMAAAAMKNGASDYLIKTPSHIQRLPESIRNTIKLRQAEIERRQMLEALKKREAEFVRAQQVARIGSWSYNPVTQQPVWSAEMFRIFGLSPGPKAPIYEDHKALIHPEDWELFDRSVYRAVNEGVGYDLELRILAPDGEVRYVNAKSEATLDERGQVTELIGTTQDITDRKLIEENLRESILRQNEAVKAGNVGLWDWDLITNKVHYSAEWKSQIGYEDHEISNDFEEWRSRVHPEDLDPTLETVQQSIASGNPNHRTEFRFRHKDGSYRWILAQASILKDDTGRSVRMLGSHVDITDRKRLQEEVLRAQKLETVGTLAGGIAHDFNNVLTMIIGNIALTKSELDPGGEAWDQLNEAETAAKRAQGLTRQLLTFAKGGLPIKETASVTDIVRESANFVMRGSTSICRFDMADDLWSAEVDVGQINQVVNNIVINARQAMPEGGDIEITAKNVIVDDRDSLPIDAGRYVLISIKDQGMGIADRHILRIFDPYFSTKQEGSGLGLATTYSIIKKHGGHITVESILGVGTTFNIYLPASKRKARRRRQRQEVKTGQGRVLIMDDEPTLLRLVGRILNKLGYETELTIDGHDAVAAYRTAIDSGKPFDAVLLDLTVPGGVGGKQAMQAILEIDPAAKAVVSSGYSDDPVLADYSKYGFKGVLPKPYEAETLNRVLQEVLKVR